MNHRTISCLMWVFCIILWSTIAVFVVAHTKTFWAAWAISFGGSVASGIIVILVTEWLEKRLCKNSKK